MEAIIPSTNNQQVEQPCTYIIDKGYSFKSFLNNKAVPLPTRIERLSRLLHITPRNLINLFKASKTISPIQVYIKYTEGNELEKDKYGSGVIGDCLQYIVYIKKINGRFLIADNCKGSFGHDLIFRNIETVEFIA